MDDPKKRFTKSEPDEAENPAPAAAPVDIAAIVKAAVEAALQAKDTTAENLAAAITQGMQQVKEPIPENKTIPETSEANPLGERDFPRTALLKCDMWIGVIQDDDDRSVVRVRQYEPGENTVAELLAMNLIQPGEYLVKMLDETTMPVKVVAQKNQATGATERMIIAYPILHLGKKSQTKNMIPGIVSVVRQITGHDLSQLSIDELRELYREHRAKNYVASVKVAA